jgi:hypothetical protein
MADSYAALYKPDSRFISDPLTPLVMITMKSIECDNIQGDDDGVLRIRINGGSVADIQCLKRRGFNIRSEHEV